MLFSSSQPPTWDAVFTGHCLQTVFLLLSGCTRFFFWQLSFSFCFLPFTWFCFSALSPTCLLSEGPPQRLQAGAVCGSTVSALQLLRFKMCPFAMEQWQSQMGVCNAQSEVWSWWRQLLQILQVLPWELFFIAGQWQAAPTRVTSWRARPLGQLVVLLTPSTSLKPPSGGPRSW